MAHSLIAGFRVARTLGLRGAGSCYVEFGAGLVGRMDVEFLAGPPTGSFFEPSIALVGEKQHFGASRQ